MALSQAGPDVVGETVQSLELAPCVNGFHLEPRCRVCRNEQVRKRVNALLATGASYAYVVRVLDGNNNTLDHRDRVTVDSVRRHCERHFPVQQTARAVYREIVERRAQHNQVDFINGVATALTPLAFFEVVMNKAFRTLVDDGAEVSVDTGLRAAEKLQAVLDKGDHSAEMAKMRVQFNWILDAVKSTVPQEMWGDILHKLDQLEHQSEALDAETEEFDDDDDPYDPTEFAEDDELWLDEDGDDG
jgi:hypothetical protein